MNESMNDSYLMISNTQMKNVQKQIKIMEYYEKFFDIEIWETKF